jgi:hypothetical protein
MLRFDRDIQFLVNPSYKDPTRLSFSMKLYFRILTWNFAHIMTSTRLASIKNFRTLYGSYFSWGHDEHIDDDSVDHQNTITQRRCVINTINSYTNVTQCVEFIQTIINEKACVITSGSLGQYIVPHLHDMSQVDSIFIFCDNKPLHESWVKSWPKIKGVFTEIGSIPDHPHLAYSYGSASVKCMKTWATMRKHVHFMNVL